MRSGPSVTVAFTNPTFKGDFSFGKDQKSQRAKYGLGGGALFPPPQKKRAVERAGAMMQIRCYARSVFVNL